MEATATPVIQHSDSLWTIFNTLAICGGIALIFAVIGTLLWIMLREDRGRPIIPWGSRMRVERAKAHTEITAEQLKQDAVDVKRIALSAQRDAVLQAVKDGDMPTVMTLGLPSGENGRVEDAAWSPGR